MLINLWYVAEWSHAVKDKPVKVKLLGQNFVLFRDATGRVQCLSDVCLHRGGSLAGGQVHRDCVACPYHGWRYNGKGEVTFIPSRGEGGKIPERARIDAYPAEERYGMIWVFLGDLAEAERYPIPPFPEFGQPGWRAVTSEYTWKASAARVVENGIDMAHASFVHPIFGHPSTADKNYIESEQHADWWATHTCVMHPPQFKDSLLRRFIRKERQPTRVHPSFYLPGYTVRLQVDLRPGWQMIMFDANTPVDEFTTRTFAVQVRSFFRQKIFDKGSEKRLMDIILQDAAIIESASPNWLPETLENELSVVQDRFMSYWRATRRKHIEKGWQIDSQALRPHEGFKTFTIPSPARREQPQLKWVLDTVPLKPAVRRGAAAAGTIEAEPLASES